MSDRYDQPEVAKPMAPCPHCGGNIVDTLGAVVTLHTEHLDAEIARLKDDIESVQAKDDEIMDAMTKRIAELEALIADAISRIESACESEVGECLNAGRWKQRAQSLLHSEGTK